MSKLQQKYVALLDGIQSHSWLIQALKYSRFLLVKAEPHTALIESTLIIDVTEKKTNSKPVALLCSSSFSSLFSPHKNN
jgi:hypothetical protein